eukprot:4926549-Alexandrium_andersonii.AAC.1
MSASLVGSEMCIRDRVSSAPSSSTAPQSKPTPATTATPATGTGSSSSSSSSRANPKPTAKPKVKIERMKSFERKAEPCAPTFDIDDDDEPLEKSFPWTMDSPPEDGIFD